MATERITPLRSGGSGLSCVCLNAALELAEARFLQRDWIRQDFSGLIKQWGYRAGATRW